MGRVGFRVQDLGFSIGGLWRRSEAGCGGAGQLVNQIKGISALTNKAKLMATLARADRVRSLLANVSGAASQTRLVQYRLRVRQVVRERPCD